MRLAVAGRPAYAYTGGADPGAGAPVVAFVHGAAHDHSAWTLQSRYLAHHGRRVLAFDLPGHGRSEGPPLASVAAIADWVVAALGAAGVREAALVGHSLGALAVLEAAARHPDRVGRIALLGPAVPMTVSESLLAASRDDPARACAMITGWSHSPARQLGGHPIPGMWMTGNAIALMERNAPGVLALDLAACNDYAGGLAAAAAVRCPVLAIVGGRDQMAPPGAARALVGALREPQVVTLPRAGHALMAEEPDAVLDALAAFL